MKTYSDNLWQPRTSYRASAQTLAYLKRLASLHPTTPPSKELTQLAKEGIALDNYSNHPVSKDQLEGDLFALIHYIARDMGNPVPAVNGFHLPEGVLHRLAEPGESRGSFSVLNDTQKRVPVLPEPQIFEDFLALERVLEHFQDKEITTPSQDKGQITVGSLFEQFIQAVDYEGTPIQSRALILDIELLCRGRQIQGQLLIPSFNQFHVLSEEQWVYTYQGIPQEDRQRAASPEKFFAEIAGLNPMFQV